MIDAKKFLKILSKMGINYAYGVPDSLLKEFCFELDEIDSPLKNQLCINEGNAIAMALGYHLGSKKVAAVYLQNSGLGNCINPIVSLAAEEIYSVPMLLIIGWRGHPSEADEPQHKVQGKITPSMLDIIGVKYEIFDRDTLDIEKVLKKLISTSTKSKSPVALLVKKGAFKKNENKSQPNFVDDFKRETAIEVIIKNIPKKALIVSTTGMASRELFELRKRHNQKHDKDFLTVGGMGYASSIGLAIAEQNKNKTVICLDGDGAILMHMGVMALIANLKFKNFVHIVLNNGAHDSVGGQKTIAKSFSLSKIAENLGYEHVKKVQNSEELFMELSKIKSKSGLRFIEIIISKGSRSDLGRPSISTKKNKKMFMDNINEHT